MLIKELLNEDRMIDTVAVRNKKRMDESVVKPYLNYLKSLGTYLKEDANSQAAQMMVKQAGGNPDQMVLPDQVKANFEKQLASVQPGPVQNFQQTIQSEIAKVPDPQVQQGLLQKAKEALKNPDTQQTLLSAVSSIAGMAAGAVSLGLGAAAAKKATAVIGQGLLASVNAKMGGASWKDSAKQGMKSSAAHAAGDELGVGAADLMNVGKGVASDAQTPNANGQVLTPAQDLKGIQQNWDQFVRYGQDLMKKMSAVVPQQAPAAA